MSLDDGGAVGYLLDIDIWQSGATRITQDGIVVKGLAPKPLSLEVPHQPSNQLEQVGAGDALEVHQ